jgi:hypothetical protein
MSRRLTVRCLLTASVVCWVALISLGGWALSQHAWSAGAAAPTPAATSPTDRPTLIVFAHPHCPCSRVTVAELAWVLDRCPIPVAVRVFLAAPEGAADGWDDTPLRAEAARLPGAVLTTDDGREATRFGARTSGHTVVYDAAGRLLFSGGVTAGRGHRGGNPGRDAALAALRDGRPGPSSPVFGCPLFPEPSSP